MTTTPTLFDKFGGVRPMASHLSESPSTVQSWKNTGRIPAGKQPAVLEKARELGIEISAEEIIFPTGLSTHEASREVVQTAPETPAPEAAIIEEDRFPFPGRAVA